jgi:hypothetical protein
MSYNSETQSSTRFNSSSFHFAQLKLCGITFLHLSDFELCYELEYHYLHILS